MVFGFPMPNVYQPRHRRDCLGELVQIDGSHHDWLEGRSPKCCLLVYIDDATGQPNQPSVIWLLPMNTLNSTVNPQHFIVIGMRFFMSASVIPNPTG